MLPGFVDDPELITDSRKTAIINHELLKLNIDIAALQETRLPSDGTLRERDYSFFWKGKEPGQPRIHGVGFAVKNSLLSSIIPPTDGTERLLSLSLSTTNGKMRLISAYAPTLLAESEDKDRFYEDLGTLISEIPSTEGLFILGDFNARIGSDLEAWAPTIGTFGHGTINDNGQRLLELCSYHNLCVTNTFFANKRRRQVSWRHPRSGRWHQLDLVVTRRSQLGSVQNTRSFHSADCNTDHALVCSNLHLKSKRLHKSKQKSVPKINTARTRSLQLCQEFNTSLDAILENCPEETDEMWSYLRDATYKTAMGTFGKRTRKQEDWFEESHETLSPALEEKRKAFLNHKAHPSPSSLAAFRTARSNAQRLARQCANEYWSSLANKIQASSDTGNMRELFKGIKTAFGPTSCKTAPLKSLDGEFIRDKSKQLDRWVQHYETLYSTENRVTLAAIDACETLPQMTELDRVPTIDELLKAIDALSIGKAPGSDGIPPEVIKAGKNSSLINKLHQLLTKCWHEKRVPQDMRDSKIITLYKNKGERSDCNNYRGISLLSIVGKVFARVVLKRLQAVADRVYPESQCGFRSKRSTVDMIFSLRQLQEKCREQNRPLYLAFIDLTKAFDLVSRDGLFTLLEKIGCPPTLLGIIRSFHDNMKASVFYDGSLSDSFGIKSGVKQGCVLAPTLFGIFFSLLLHHAFKESDEGVYIHTRSDGGLFNLSRLRAKTKVRHVLIRELLFADDAALATHSADTLQRLVNQFSSACCEFGLTISLKKTQVLSQNPDITEPQIHIGDTVLENVDTFTYLGSAVSHKLHLETELSRRIGKASSTMARLSKRVWENRLLTTRTKMKVYNACVLSTLLYGSECWPMYAQQEAKYNSFHMRCLRKILRVTWKDKIPNQEILERTSSQSLHSTLAHRRLRWLGHVHRMDGGRIPKDLMYGELSTGARSRGRPYLRFKDVLKRDIKAFQLPVTSWERIASDRDKWRAALSRGSKLCEQQRLQRWEQRRTSRRSRASSST